MNNVKVKLIEGHLFVTLNLTPQEIKDVEAYAPDAMAIYKDNSGEQEVYRIYASATGKNQFDSAGAEINPTRKPNSPVVFHKEINLSEATTEEEMKDMVYKKWGGTLSRLNTITTHLKNILPKAEASKTRITEAIEVVQTAEDKREAQEEND